MGPSWKAESFPRAMATAGRGCPGTGLGLPVPPELPFSLGGRGPAPRSCLENEWLRLQALSHRATPSHRRLFSMHKVPVVTRCLFITCRESKEPGFGTERGVTASARSQQAAPGLRAALLPSGNRAALRTHRGLPSLSPGGGGCWEATRGLCRGRAPVRAPTSVLRQVTCERSAGSSSS